MPAQLVSLSEGPSILLDKPILLLGRHPECDIQIESRKISRRHCCVAQVEDYLVIRDLGSTNGVRINGVRVLEGRLRANDELTIGANRYRVSWDVVVAEPRRSEKVARKRPAPSPDAITPPEESGFRSCDEPIALSESNNHDMNQGRRPTPRAIPAGQPLAPANPPSDPELIPGHLGIVPAESLDQLPKPKSRRP
jgi:predicted component of type VI protein secretion system